MKITLARRHLGVHTHINEAEIPGAFSDYATPDPQGGHDAYLIDEEKLLAAIPRPFLPVNPIGVLLTVMDDIGGTGQTGLTRFRSWAKYFDAYVLNLVKEEDGQTPADHSPYIEAVSNALEAAGLPVTSITIEKAPHRKAAIAVTPDSNGESIQLLWDEETNVWEYELSRDGWWDAKTRDRLPGGLTAPPAVVVSELLYDSAYARHRLVAEIPDDLDSALAAYAPKPGPRPGQQVTDAEGDVWTYVDCGRKELMLISDLALGFFTRAEAEERFGPLVPVTDEETGR